jgi:N utilization substance protein B
MQSLFEWDFGNHKDADIKEILLRNAAEFAPGMNDHSFLSELAENILKKRSDLDTIIEKAAPEWPIDKISIVDRNILRLGLYELLFSDREEVPAKVAINEAIELAKTFGGENSGKFVNGVLGSVYKELGEPGKDAPRAARQKSNAGNVDPKNFPIEKLGGAVVYARKAKGKTEGKTEGTEDDEIYLALVHDIFGHWTLSKGHFAEGESDAIGIKRVIKEEISLDVELQDELGRNEYIASDPEKGKIRKQVLYFLAESPYVPVKLAKSGGLDQAEWFRVQDILDLNFYNDILPIVTKAIQILLKQGAAGNAGSVVATGADARGVAASGTVGSDTANRAATKSGKGVKGAKGAKADMDPKFLS